MTHDVWILGLSVAIAVLASYVGLDLAMRVYRAVNRRERVVWLSAGALTLGTGIWSMHFVGMSIAQFRFTVGYDTGLTGLSWAAAVALSAFVLAVASLERLPGPVLALGASITGIGASAMHDIGVRAVVVHPGVAHDWAWMAASVVVAVVGPGLALRLAPGLRHVSGWRRMSLQIGVASVFGGSLAAMHYFAMAGNSYVDGSICLSTGGLDARKLGPMTGVAAGLISLVMLLMTTLRRWNDSHAKTMSRALATAQHDLQFVTMNDVVTGLPNRLVFQDRLKQATARADRSGNSLAVVLLDVDAFRHVNSALGEAGGDEALKVIAARMTMLVRSSGTIARVGIDEFLLLFESIGDKAELVDRVDSLRSALSAPIPTASGTCRVTVSAGVTIYPLDGSLEQLVSNADAAVSGVKEAGGNGFAFFEAALSRRAQSDSDLVRDLRVALERHELVLFYQPNVRAQTGLITGAEALLRWRHPTRGFVPPAVFIPLAERFGLINAIGSWVIEEACRQMQAWRDIGLVMRVAVNLSVHQLRQPSLCDELRSAMDRHGVPSGLLTCEVTESMAMDVSASMLAVFERLRASGVLLSIDDFGTGYSSLNYLRKLPVHQLKIDRSFVLDLAHDQDACAVVTAIVQLAHALRMEVVAEGVETAAQHDVLRAIGVDKFQGYLFARPMPADMLAQWSQSREEGRVDFGPSLFAA